MTDISLKSLKHWTEILLPVAAQVGIGNDILSETRTAGH